MKKNKKKLLSILAMGALTTSLVLSGGCGKEEEQKDIAVILKSNGQFWETPKMGAKDAGEELNIRLSFNAPEAEDVKAQANYVKKAVSDKVDAIIIAPSADDDELAEALQLAQNNGVKVLTIDSDVREEARSCCISTNNTYAGAIAARQAADLLGGQGSIGIVIHSPTASNSIERKSGFTSQIDNYNATAGENVINIAATENGDGNILESKEAALRLMNDNPDIGLIFATSQSTTIGACMAVDELGRADSVDVIGFDSFYSREGSKSSDEYMDSGVLDGFILQNPYNAGYISVRYANDLINGQNIAGSVDTGATFVTKDNINNSDIQLIMNPTKFMEEFNNG